MKPTQLEKKVETALGKKVIPDGADLTVTLEDSIVATVLDRSGKETTVEIMAKGDFYSSEKCLEKALGREQKEEGGLVAKCVSHLKVKQSISFDPNKVKHAREIILKACQSLTPKEEKRGIPRRFVPETPSRFWKQSRRPQIA